MTSSSWRRHHDVVIMTSSSWRRRRDVDPPGTTGRWQLASHVQYIVGPAGLLHLAPMHGDSPV